MKNRGMNYAGRGLWTLPSVSGTGLKNFATIMMVIGTFAVAVLENGSIHLSSYTQAELNDAMAADSNLMFQAGMASIMELLASMALPLFTFLLVEGFLHTTDLKKYCARIAMLAVISEIPYDLAFNGKWTDFSGQNPVLGLLICLVMLACLRYIKEHKHGAVCALLEILIVLCAVTWVSLIRAQYGFCIVLLAAVFYLFREKNGLKILLGILISLLYVAAPLAFFGIWCYNGDRKDPLPRYTYYALYPIHLLILWLIGSLI